MVQAAGVTVGGLIGGKLFMNAQSFMYEFMEGFNPYGNLIGALASLLIVKLLQWGIAKVEHKIYKTKDDTNSEKEKIADSKRSTTTSEANRPQKNTD